MKKKEVLKTIQGIVSLESKKKTMIIGAITPFFWAHAVAFGMVRMCSYDQEKFMGKLMNSIGYAAIFLLVGSCAGSFYLLFFPESFINGNIDGPYERMNLISTIILIVILIAYQATMSFVGFEISQEGTKIKKSGI